MRDRMDSIQWKGPTSASMLIFVCAVAPKEVANSVVV